MSSRVVLTAVMGTTLNPTVLELWRYPVKSLQGERLAAVNVEVDGLDGDRRWGIRDESTGRVLTGRREPRLLEAAARLGEGSEPLIVLPGGAVLDGPGKATDAALSNWLARPVRLVPANVERGDRAEYFADATDDASAAIEWTMPPGRFVDAMALLVLTTASLRAGAARYPDGDWDVRRFAQTSSSMRPVRAGRRTAGARGPFESATSSCWHSSPVSAARW